MMMIKENPKAASLIGLPQVNRKRDLNESFGSSSMATCWLVLVLAFVVLLAQLASVQGAQAVSISTEPAGDMVLPQHSAQQASDYNNNLEDLISDLLDDAGNRLKKSKLSSMRQIKQTLRFGRRSDPRLAPSYGFADRFELGEVNNQQPMRRLIAQIDN